MKRVFIIVSVAAAVSGAAFFLFRQCKGKHQPIMTFKDLYRDNGR